MLRTGTHGYARFYFMDMNGSSLLRFELLQENTTCE